MFKMTRVILAVAGATLLHAGLVLIEPSGSDAQFIAELVMQLTLIIIGLMLLVTMIAWRPER